MATTYPQSERQHIYRIKDDRLIPIRAKLTYSNGQAYDLTGKSAVLRAVKANDSSVVLIADQTMTITSATEGLVEYRPSALEAAEIGEWECSVIVTGSGFLGHFPNRRFKFLLTVEAKP